MDQSLVKGCCFLADWFPEMEGGKGRMRKVSRREQMACRRDGKALIVLHCFAHPLLFAYIRMMENDPARATLT